MFTGIITQVGRCVKKTQKGIVFEVRKNFIRQLTKGSSIAINGVCLTIAGLPGSAQFRVEIMPETLKRTMLQNLKVDDPVNLELPLTPEGFLSGHFVQGHVDGVGIITRIKQEGNSKILTIKASKQLGRYIVEKSSIAINGISLTVIKVSSDYFTVGIIPYTLTHTMLYNIKVGDWVNLEVDILAKYVEKLMKGVRHERR